MESQTESKNNLLNKRISVFYEDGTGRVSRKDGVCSINSDTEIELDNRVIIPKSRLVRVEVQR